MTAFAPIVTSLSTIARSSTAPGPTSVSNMTIESRTVAPAATRTPGDRMLRSTVPWTTQPWLTIERDTVAEAATNAGARSSLRV